ncbi:DsbA family protein [Endozoicomonadaceae bacterium StTr2]
MNLRKLALAGLMAVVVSPTMAATGDLFNTDQKEEIQNIVREYLLENPEVLLDVSRALEAKQKLAQLQNDKLIIAENADALFNSPADPVGGNPKGTITLVEFLDYNCGYCKRARPLVEHLVANNSDLRVVYKELPILSEGSVYASQAAMAVNQLWPEQYTPFHEALMSERGVDAAKVKAVAEQLKLDWDKLEAALQSESVKQALNANHRLASELGISGTPAFIMGNQIVRGMNPQALQQALEEAREAL